MLVACRLAGLSALDLRLCGSTYRRAAIGAGTGRWGMSQEPAPPLSARGPVFRAEGGAKAAMMRRGGDEKGGPKAEGAGWRSQRRSPP